MSDSLAREKEFCAGKIPELKPRKFTGEHMKTGFEAKVSQYCQNIFLPLALMLVGFIGVAKAQMAANSPTNSKPVQPAVRDGSHDFDFIYGKWRMPNHRLVKRLAGSHEWVDFISCTEGMPLAGGIGDMDVFRTDYWKDFVGITIRTYDPETGLWRLYWFDNRFSHGEIQPPVVGKFNGNVGVFEGKDTFNGKPIIARFTWTVNPKGSEVVAKWEQAFSPDDGKTWETNWQNEFIHDEQCTPN
jgi:hypothetical protein